MALGKRDSSSRMARIPGWIDYERSMYILREREREREREKERERERRK